MPIETLTKPRPPANAKPFLFDRSFDRAQAARKPALAQAAEPAREAAEAMAAVAPEPEAPPPPSFSEEELEAARALAREEGRLAGLEEARAAREAHALVLLEDIRRDMARLREDDASRTRTLEAGCLELVRASFAKLLPAYAATHGAGEIEAVVRDALDLMLSAETVTLRLPSGDTEMLTPRIEETARAAGFEGRIRILPDPALGPSDVSVDWGDGEATRRLDHALARLDESLAAAIGRLGQDEGMGHHGAMPGEKETG